MTFVDLFRKSNEIAQSDMISCCTKQYILVFTGRGPDFKAQECLISKCDEIV